MDIGARYTYLDPGGHIVDNDDFFAARPGPGDHPEHVDQPGMPEPVADHYAALGISPRAGADEVSAAYGRRVAELRAREQAATDADDLSAAQYELAAVEDAWRVLSDPGQRSTYDLSDLSGATVPMGVDPNLGIPYEQPTTKPAIWQRPAVWVTGLAIAGVVGAGVFFAPASRDDTGAVVNSGDLDITDLRVGDCFDSAIDSTDFGETTELNSVTAIPCHETHTNEVYAFHDLPNPEGAPYPGEDTVFERSGLLCLTSFREFVGVAYEDSVLDISVVYPTQGTWEDGDREVICAVYDLGGPVTGTLEGANR